MTITKETKLCISIAARPGDFGTTIFNAAFDALSLDYIYKPFKVEVADLPAAIEAIKVFSIRGCGVSMPHKVSALKYLDRLDSVAEKIGAINTIVNDGGILTGYNTDYYGAKSAIKENYEVKGKKVLLIGAGGAARAIILALKELGAGEIHLANREAAAGQRVAQEFELCYCPFENINDFKGNLLINATPVGMTPETNVMIVRPASLANFEAVMDVVIYPSETLLLKTARAAGKTIIYGFRMSLFQAVYQFELYTGCPAPIEVMAENMKIFFKNNQ